MIEDIVYYYATPSAAIFLSPNLGFRKVQNVHSLAKVEFRTDFLCILSLCSDFRCKFDINYDRKYILGSLKKLASFNHFPYPL